MNHERTLGVYRPLHLLAECLYLFVLKLTAPVEVEPHLADGHKLAAVFLPYQPQLLAPVGFHFFGMQTDHRIEKSFILAAQFEHPVYRSEIDGRQQHMMHALLHRPFHDKRYIIPSYGTSELASFIAHL